MVKDKSGYCVILNKRDNGACVLKSADYMAFRRQVKSRLANGFYRESGKFSIFQDLYDNDPGSVEVLGYDKRHRVFVENEVKAMGYRVMEEGELVRVVKNRKVKVPDDYRGVVLGLIKLLDSGKVKVWEFEKYLEVVGEG